jgi:hypothetical protein
LRASLTLVVVLLLARQADFDGSGRDRARKTSSRQETAPNGRAPFDRAATPHAADLRCPSRQTLGSLHRQTHYPLRWRDRTTRLAIGPWMLSFLLAQWRIPTNGPHEAVAVHQLNPNPVRFAPTRER